MRTDGPIRAFFRRRAQRRDSEKARRAEAARLRRRVEAAVDATEPRIRMVRDYDKRLRGPVKHALAYAQQAAEEIPGPFDIRIGLWGRDPLVTAYFAAAGEVRSTLGTSASLRRFFIDRPVQEAYALLTMKPEEKRVFRTAASGELLQRDVARTSVNFYRHRCTSVHATLSGLREELKDRAFQFLLSCALEVLVALQRQEERLAHQHEMLQVQWRLQQSREEGLAALLDPAADGRGAGEQILAEVSRQLDSVRSRIDEPADYLFHLEQVLAAPQRHLSLAPAAPRLDQMGLKVRASDPDPGHEIPYAVLSLGATHRTRAAVVARIFRNDVMDGQGPSGG